MAQQVAAILVRLVLKIACACTSIRRRTGFHEDLNGQAGVNVAPSFDVIVIDTARFPIFSSVSKVILAECRSRCAGDFFKNF